MVDTPSNDKLEESIKTLIKAAQEDQELELEVRVGVIDPDGKFSPGVTRERFENVSNILGISKYNWTSVSDWEDSRDYVTHDSLRLTTTHQGKRMAMKKILHSRIDVRPVFGGDISSDVVVRFSAKKEVHVQLTTTTLPSNIKTVRAKRRKTFTDSMWQYDLTGVYQADSEESLAQNQPDPIFEIELEVGQDKWDRSKTTDDITQSLLAKTQDIVRQLLLVDELPYFEIIE